MATHYETDNISFLKMYKILKDMGIKNNKFFLQIYDDSLIDVDPYDENLSEVEITKIIAEIYRNPWYFLREVLRIPAGNDLFRYELHRGNLAATWAMINNMSIYLVLPRQCYKTLSVISYSLWDFYFGSKNTNQMWFGHEDSLLLKNIEEFKNLRDALPDYLQLSDTKRDKDNTNELSFKRLGNTIKKKAPPLSRDKATKAGRGFTASRLWLDEFEHIVNIDEIYKSAVFSYSTVSEIAKRSGGSYGRTITTTAGYLNTLHGKWAYEFCTKSADFEEKLYDMPILDVRKYITNSSTNGFLSVEYQYYDLGKDDAYLQRQYELTNGDIDTINREIFNKRIDVTKMHPLGQDRVARLVDSIIKPKEVMIINDIYLLKLYMGLRDIHFNKKYVIGMDSSGNLMNDFTTLTIVDPETGEVIGTMRTNSFSTAKFANAVSFIMRNVFPKSILVAESNSMGIAILDIIIQSSRSLLSRIYHQADKNVDDLKKMASAFVGGAHDMYGKPGVTTNKEIRDLLFKDILRLIADDYYAGIHDKHIIREITTLEITRTGKVDHRKGEHDDALVSYLLVFWFLLYATNRSRYVDPLSILSNDKIKRKENDKISESKRKKTLHQYVKERRLKEFQEYEEKIKKKKDALDKISKKHETEGKPGGRYINNDEQNIKYVKNDNIDDSDIDTTDLKGIRDFMHKSSVYDLSGFNFNKIL